MSVNKLYIHLCCTMRLLGLFSNIVKDHSCRIQNCINCPLSNNFRFFIVETKVSLLLIRYVRDKNVTQCLKSLVL